MTQLVFSLLAAVVLSCGTLHAQTTITKAPQQAEDPSRQEIRELSSSFKGMLGELNDQLVMVKKMSSEGDGASSEKYSEMSSVIMEDISTAEGHLTKISAMDPKTWAASKGEMQELAATMQKRVAERSGTLKEALGEK